MPLLLDMGLGFVFGGVGYRGSMASADRILEAFLDDRETEGLIRLSFAVFLYRLQSLADLPMMACASNRFELSEKAGAARCSLPFQLDCEQTQTGSA